MSQSVRGSCLCGGVRYEVTGPFLRAGHCHCSRCRKHSGAAASTQGRVLRQDFRLISGADLIRSYQPDGGAVKAFCSVCGSSLFGGSWPEGPEVSIRLGSVDGDPGIRPQDHTHVDSRAPWDEIHDGLPQYPGPRPTAELPIACDLGPAELATRRDQLLSGLLARAGAREPIAGGFRWRFEPADGLVQEIAAIVDAEHRCCRFLRFVLRVEPGDGPIGLEVTGPDETAEFLSALLDPALPR